MPAFVEIDEVAAVPEFGNSGRSGWGFTLWGDATSNDGIYRGLLESFASEFPDTKLILPPWQEHEDMIEGTMVWKGRSVSVWFETALSHIFLWTDDRDAMTDLRSAILPFTECA